MIESFAARFLGIFLEAAPFLLLGSIVSGLIEVFVDRARLTRLVPRTPLGAVAAGTALGFLFPVCECGVVPVTRRLYTKGLPISAGVAFLLASPVINPIVLATTWTAFGLGPMLVGRYVVTAVVALAIGLVFAAGNSGHQLLRAEAIPAMSGGEALAAHGTQVGWVGRARMAVGLAADEFLDMGRYLVLGSALAAGLQTMVSQDALVTVGGDPVRSVFAMQGFAYLLSVCSTVDAFIALAFTGTFTSGALLAFLTFGPMVDVKSTLMFLGVFRPRVVAYLVLLPFLMTAFVAIWVNLNLGL
jgi:uncharacterized protein